MASRYMTAWSPRTATSANDSSRDSFQKLFASVADPQTQNNHARHLALTKNILYENEIGWKVAELPLVSDLLQVLRNKVLDGAPQFDEQLVLVVLRCCKPFIRQKSNEEVSNPSLLYGLLPTLGELLFFEDIEVQVAATEALRTFATGACLPRVAPKMRNNNSENKSPDDLRLTPRIFSQNIMEETGTVDAIVAVMHDLFPDDELEREEEYPKESQSVENTEPTEGFMSANQQDSSDHPNDQQECASDVSVEPEIIVENEQDHTGVVQQNDQDNTGIVQQNDEDQVALQVKKPMSAPPHGRNGASHHGDIVSNENLVQHDQIATRATKKPTSAPSITYPGSNGTGWAKIDSPGSRPESNRADTSECSITPQNQPTDEITINVEEELMQVIGSALPIQMRLSALLFPLIELLCELSAYQRCAEVLVVSGSLHYVVFILENITNPQDELLPLCLEILWNVLELSHEKISSTIKCLSRKELLEVFRLRNATFFLGSEFTFQALLHVLELLLARGFRQQDKEMRNECLMILHMLAKRRRSLDFFYSTGLTGCLFSYAISAELSYAQGRHPDKFSATASAITASNHYYATNSDEDFEFKHMLWFLLAEISCDHQANLSELVQFKFVEIWLSYAISNHGGDNQHQEGATSRASAHKYSTPQIQLLQWTALSVLNHVAPFVAEHFFEVGGHAKLLNLLQLNMGNDDVLASAWLLMLQVSPPRQFFQAELGKLGVIEIAMEIFEAQPSRNTFAIRRNAILVCANMCRNDEGSNRKRFRQANGVHALLQYLEFDPSYSVLEENILVGIIEGVRSCVFGDHESEMTFINGDGVPKLLSILGAAPKALKHQTLAALAEICVNPAAIPSYQMWRCDQPGENNNAGANQLLLRIYADEEAAEKRANQDSTENGALTPANDVPHQNSFQSITNCRSPFIVTPETTTAGDAQPSSTSRPESPAFSRLKAALKASQGLAQKKQSTRSILQLENHQIHPEVNLKAKIYAVLANVSVVSETENLSPQDQVMLEIAKEYPTFKLGEMWQIVERALHAEGVRPIYADALYIRQNIEHAYNVSVCTKLAQQEVFARSRQLTTEREDAFFEQILRQKHQEAQAEKFYRACCRQNSTMQLHLDAKKTRLEFMRRQDPAAFAAYESEERCLIRDPPPVYVDEQEGLRTLMQNEAELRGRLSTIKRPRKHTL